MADELQPRKAHPLVRLLAGIGCMVFIALGVLFFPVAGLAEQPWQLSAPLGAVIGAVFCGRVAVTGRRASR